MYLYTWVHFSGRFGSFQSGFRTELEAAKHAIHLQEKWFEGSPVFHDDGQEYVPEPEDGDQRPKYVGEPSKEIDHNWEQLHWGRFFLLSEEEARSAWGPDYTKFWAPREGGYVAATTYARHFRRNPTQRTAPYMVDCTETIVLIIYARQ
ncbi:uncharacterized protein GLRG_11750 [Colletotrichum graminicola M1.001]|uniref:Uncharacterized protein n=1 Tax=Colletotrichum graminicola (strain M1.001 / M2 / FGSC 10212) TaxID=645133 RepID=E3R0G7_COLGM|nr:uncharacterized protein GLRG_11750 [Colletotrichum graminicola M1.001]EFQ36605.1 hypothetical protein GLRG_11750 [Colletotrichum graminicola M1.001]